MDCTLQSRLTKNAFKDREDYSLLFSTKEEQDKWFKEIQQNPQYEPLLNEIQQEADRLIDQPLPELTFSIFKLYEETGTRIKYEATYFLRRRYLNTFTLMTLLYPENQDYLEKLQNIIWSICNEYTWCLPAHFRGGPEIAIKDHYSLDREVDEYTIDLFAAETAFALSEILHLTKDRINPLIEKRMIQEIYRRVFWPYIHQEESWWETTTNNWAAVCAGSIGAAALHLMDDQEELAEILNRVLWTMDHFLAGFSDDGACLEGYLYWEYGFGFFVYFADLLKKRTKEPLDLFAQKKIQKIALFQQKTFLYKNTVANFSDTTPTSPIFLGLSHYLAQLYEEFEVPEENLRASYTDDHCSRWASAFRNLYWYNPDLQGKPWRSKSYFLEDAQWLISRHSSKNGYFAFAMKGGHNDEPHNHNDIGHFILQKEDEVFLKDIGQGLYSRDYFSEKRYSFLMNHSKGHSVPIINQQYQVEGKEFQAEIENFHLSAEVDEINLNMTKAYQIPSLESLTRKFLWEKKELPVLTLIDQYKFSKQPTEVIERFILPVVTVEENDQGLMIQGENSLQIIFDQDQLSWEKTILTFKDDKGKEDHVLALDFYRTSLAKEMKVKLQFLFLA